MEKEPDQQYFLYFDNYRKVLNDNLHDFLRRQVFVNVTLICAGAKLKAHQSILSACSPLFENILTDTAETHPVIVFRDVSKDEMVALLEYMYKGQVNVSKSFLPALLRAARSLQIRGLEHEENNNSQEHSPQFGTNGYQANDSFPKVSSQQMRTPRTSVSGSFPAPPIPNVVRDAEGEIPPTVPTLTSPTDNALKDANAKVINPFATKRTDSDTTFCEDDLAMPGPSKIPTEKEKEAVQQPATNNDDSDIEFIENNPTIVVINETQREDDTPPWYRKTVPRNRRHLRRQVKPSRSLEEFDYTSDDSDIVSVSKKSRKNPTVESNSEGEHSRVLLNPLALKSRGVKKNQSDLAEWKPKNWLVKRHKPASTPQVHDEKDITDEEFVRMSMQELGCACVVCQKFYKDIRSHTRIVHNTAPKPMVCKKCSKKFNFKDFYNAHSCLK